MIQFMKMIKEKSEVKPILLKVGTALALSFAVFIYSRSATRTTKSPRLTKPRSPDDSIAAVAGDERVRHVDDQDSKKTSSSCSIVSNLIENHEEKRVQTMTVDTFPAGPLSSSEQGEEKDRLLLPEFNEIARDLDFGANDAGKISGEYVRETKLDADSPSACVSHDKDNDKLIWKLKDTVRVLQERERRLEIQLLEYYGLKEQEAAMMELQNRLERTSLECKMLSIKIESLQSENRRLEAQLDDHARVVSELDAAKTKIRVLKKKLRDDAELMSKEQILKLKEKVSQLQDQEIDAASRDEETRIRLQRLKDVETEACDSRESNLRLQENQESTKKIEQLQSDHCSDVEELVYKRWINSCLRNEILNHQAVPLKTIARELSNSLSPKSENQIKQLIVEYADGEGEGEGRDCRRGSSMDFDSEWRSASQASSISYSGELDDSSADFTYSRKSNNASKGKFFSKLRNLVRRKKGGNHDSQGERIRSLQESRCLLSTGNDAEVESHKDGSSSSSQTASVTDSQYRRAMSMREWSVESKNRNVGGSHVMRGRRRSADFRGSLNLPTESSEKSDQLLIKYAEILKVSSGSASSNFLVQSSNGS